MAVTGAEALAVIELHIIAETAVTPGDRHDAVGHRIDGRAIAAAEIHAAVHPLVAEDRVAAHPEVRSDARSEEHTSELQSLMRISYAVFCLKKKKTQNQKLQNYTRNKLAP